MNDSNRFGRRVVLSNVSLFTLGLAGCFSRDNSEDQRSSEGDETHDSHDDEGEGSHNHDHDVDHELGAPVSEIDVEMATNDEGYHFTPHVVHVESGGTVRWVLESGSHDTVAYHPDTHGEQRRLPDDADPWESETLSDEGETFERTFEVEGVYDYACTPHEDAGMVGTVVVGWPDPAEEPGLEPPADELPAEAIDQLERYNDRVREVLERGEGQDQSGHEGDDGHDDHDDTDDNQNQDSHDDHDHDH